MTDPDIRISHDPDGTLDEVVAHGVDLHLEAMSEGQWWMTIRKGRRHWDINLGSEPYAHIEEDA